MAVRAIWKGSMNFGLVTLPMGLYSATEEKRVAFHKVHGDDGARVGYQQVCKADGKVLAPEDIARGFELDDGDMVVLTDEDFEAIPAVARKTLAVEAFVPEAQIDPVLYTKSYFVVPDKPGIRAYTLMRDALAVSGQVAVVRFAMRERETLAVVRVADGGVMVLESMLWPDEVKKADFDFLDVAVTPKPAELAQAKLLIDAMSRDWDPEEFHDTYRQAVQEMIEAKIAGREVVTPPAAPAEAGAQIIDIMAALQASIDAAKKTRPADDSAPAPTRAPAKKAAAKTPSRAAKGARSAAAVTDLHAKPARKAAAKKTTPGRRSA
jgi:DNA end-binding protein Ku